MNIAIVTHWRFPTDIEIRVRKIGRSLSDKGHNVFVLAKELNIDDARNCDYCNIQGFGYFSAWPILNRLLSMPIPLNILWTFWIVQVGKKERLDCIIARDLRLALPAIFAAKLLQIPIILDYGENFPAMYKSSGKQQIRHYITRNVRFAATLERTCARWAGHVWVVVEENRDRLVEMGISRTKITVLSNTPELSGIMREKAVSSFCSRSNDCFRMIFVGVVTVNRGLDLILRSIHYMLEKEGGIEFLVVGDGNDRPRLERLATSLGIGHSVNFVGWIGSEDVPNLIHKSDVGLIPHSINEHIQTTIPNKLFDYMMAGIPVVSADIRPIRRVLETEGCGLTIPDDPKEVARIILELKASPELRARMGENGRKAIQRKYNWAEESKEIFQTIGRLT